MTEAGASRRESGAAEIPTFIFVLFTVTEHEDMFDHFLLKNFIDLFGEFRDNDIYGFKLGFTPKYL